MPDLKDLPFVARALARLLEEEKWTSLVSSNLSAFRYAEGVRTEGGATASGGELTIRFASGRTYTYFGVEPDVAAGLGSADSAGSYFWRNIKDQYLYEER